MIIEATTTRTCVIGQSDNAQQIRDELAANGVDNASVIDSLGRLRRTLVLGATELVFLCVHLDDRTVETFGPALRRLLADRHGFASTVRSIGLQSHQDGAARHGLELDACVSSTVHAATLIRTMQDAWQTVDARAQQFGVSPTFATHVPAGIDRWMHGTEPVARSEGIERRFDEDRSEAGPQ